MHVIPGKRPRHGMSLSPRGWTALVVILAGCVLLALRMDWTQPVRFHGHAAPIRSVLASANGKALASIDERGTIKLWDVASQQELATLHGNQVALSPNGELAAWSENHVVRLWSLVNRREGSALSGPSGSVDSLAFSPDGQTLATGSRDGTIRLWDVARGHCKACWSQPRSGSYPQSVDRLRFSPDGATLVSVCDGSQTTLWLWDVATGKIRATLEVFGGDSEAPVAFAPDGKVLATGGESPIVLWDVATATKKVVLEAYSGQENSMVFSPDGKTLAVVGDAITFWDVGSGKIKATWEKGARRPRPHLFRWVWDAFPSVFEEYTYEPVCVSFTADGAPVACGYDSRDPKALEMRRCQPRYREAAD